MQAGRAAARQVGWFWSVAVGVLAICAFVLSGTTAPGDTAARASSPALRMANPAAVYCTDLGYQYTVSHAASGERGLCVFPDGGECPAWDFLSGACGSEHSYCTQEGYDLVRAADGRDPFSAEYAVCVAPSGEVVGSVTDLTRLAEKTREAGCLSALAGAPERPAASDAAPRIDAGRVLPASFDWRNNGGNWLTPIRDQGNCGSCWAFATIGAVEAAFNISAADTTLDLDLSEQYLVSDCSGAGSCCGGWYDTALEYVRTAGVPDEACLPYVDGTACSCNGKTCGSECAYRGVGQCSEKTCSQRCGDWSTRLEQITNWGWVPADRTSIKQHLIDFGPLAAALNMDGSFTGDVYRCAPDFPVNHGVVIVGYDDAGSYWIVRNSWGTGFEASGYFKVGYGECSIEDYVDYAEVQSTANPGRVSGLAAAAGNGQVALTWRKPASSGTSPITDYVVQYRAVGAATWRTFNDGASPALYATVTGLTNGTPYEFKVAAKSAVGRGSYSAAVSATPQPTGTVKPGKPRSLTATPGSQQVALAWVQPASQGSSPVTDYVVQYRAVGAATWGTFNDGVSPALYATVTGLTNGTPYEFKVAAKSAVGRGLYTAPVPATPTGGASNDRFADAVTLSGASGTATGSNLGATLETGEPTHHGHASHSVWWRWTAPGSGLVAFNTNGSNFDTVMVAYTGSAVNALTEVAWDDDSGTGLQSALGFNALAGTTYRIVVDGYGSNTGDITLNWTQQTGPANDMFANAIALSGATGSTTGSNQGATAEANEPNHHGDLSHSVWWNWTAPSSGPATFDTNGSTFDTVLAVYTGASVGGLSLVVEDDDSGDSTQSLVGFNAVAGTTYRIAVDGYSTNTGNITLNWSLQSGPVGPPNDMFANAILLPGVGTTTGSNVGATVETGEPNHWVTCRTRCGGSGPRPARASSPSTPLGRPSTRCSRLHRHRLPPHLGGGERGLPATLAEQRELLGDPGHHLPHRRGRAHQHREHHPQLVFPGGTAERHVRQRHHPLRTSGTTTGSNVAATKEPNEPNHHGDLSHSVWWSWTAPASGTRSFRTAGSAFDTVLAVYTGTAVNALTLVGEHDGCRRGNDIVTFAAVAGTTYRIVVDG